MKIELKVVRVGESGHLS